MVCVIMVHPSEKETISIISPRKQTIDIFPTLFYTKNMKIRFLV